MNLNASSLMQTAADYRLRAKRCLEIAALRREGYSLDLNISRLHETGVGRDLLVEKGSEFRRRASDWIDQLDFQEIAAHRGIMHGCSQGFRQALNNFMIHFGRSEQPIPNSHMDTTQRGIIRQARQVRGKRRAALL